MWFKRSGQGFYVAPFTPAGEAQGVDFWRYKKLSHKWMSTCRGFLDEHGDRFDVSWGQQLSDVTTRFTAADGAGLATFRYDDRIALSMLLLVASNDEAVAMFVGTMDRHAASSGTVVADGFAQVHALRERPLLVVVPTADPAIAEDDFELVRELSLHFAAAYFRREISCRGG